jgi:hypothetical protein
MIFTRGLFKHRALRFDLPGKIDEPFYLDIKNRIAENPGFRFETEVNLWKLYSGLLILSLITCLAIFLLFVLVVVNLRNPVLLIICLLIAVIGIRPSIYFGMLLFHFLKYRRDEKRFHCDFSRTISQSDNFADFTNRFYSGRYSETTTLKAYFLTMTLEPFRNLAEGKGLTSNLCIYKHGKGDNYIVLSNSVELIYFIDGHEGILPVESHDPVLKIVKEQVEFPYVYGNKRLKYLID